MIAAAKSPYFEGLLRSGLRETREGQIEMNSFSLTTMKVVVEYMYSSVIPYDECDDFLELYAAASMLGIKKLEKELAYVLVYNMTVENACSIFALADRTMSDHMLQVSIRFITDNMDAVMATPDYANHVQVMGWCSPSLKTHD